jgi:hypothetical protein
MDRTANNFEARAVQTATTAVSELHLDIAPDALRDKLQVVASRSKSFPYGVYDEIPTLHGLSIADVLGSYVASEIKEISELIDKSNKIKYQINPPEQSLSSSTNATSSENYSAKTFWEILRALPAMASRLFFSEAQQTQAPAPPSVWLSAVSAEKREDLENQLSDLDRRTSKCLDHITSKIQEALSGARFYISASAGDPTLLEALLMRSGDIRPAGITFPERDFLEIGQPKRTPDAVETDANFLDETAPDTETQGLQTDQESVLCQEENSSPDEFCTVFGPEDIVSDQGIAARFLVERLLARGVKVKVHRHTPKEETKKLFIEVAGFCYLLDPKDCTAPRGVLTVTEWDKSAPDKGAELTMEPAIIGTNWLLQEIDRLHAEANATKHSRAIEQFKRQEEHFTIAGADELHRILHSPGDACISSRVTAAGGKIICLPDPDSPHSLINQEVYISYPNFTVVISRDFNSSIERKPEDSERSIKWPSWSIQVVEGAEVPVKILNHRFINRRNLEPIITWVLDEIELQEEHIKDSLLREARQNLPVARKWR